MVPWLMLLACSPAETPSAAPLAPGQSAAVAYRLTATNHVLVRARIQGKGPFHFIIDTGAPALFLGKKAAEKIGVVPDEKGWARWSSMELEGGLQLGPVEGRIDDLFQLEGMNGMGLPGVELHGVIGYNVLARYRIEYDFTRPHLTWTRLDFTPRALAGPGGGKSAAAGLQMLGGMMKFLGSMMGVKPETPREPRGFLAADFVEESDGILVRQTLKLGPADLAGLKPGDRVLAINALPVRTLADLTQKLREQPAGKTVSFQIRRAGQDSTIAIPLARGF